MHYAAYGLVLSSTLPLPELPPADAARSTLYIRTRSQGLTDRGWRWLQARPRRRAGTWVAVAARAGDYRLLFDGGAQFVFTPSTASIVVHGGAALPKRALRHRLLDQVVPIVMSHRGRVVLHASAVATRAGAVAFVGPAGAGKSTLACSFARADTPVVSDDALVLQQQRGAWLAAPSYPGVRVWRGGAKQRLTPSDGVPFSNCRAPLRRVYVLDGVKGLRGSPARVEPLPARDSMMALIEYAFVLDTEDRERLAAHFSRVAAAAAALDVRRLVYRRSTRALPAVRDAVLADLER